MEGDKDKMALKLKEEGNVMFKAKNYNGAIQKYSQAIVIPLLLRLTVLTLVFSTLIVRDASANSNNSKKYRNGHIQSYTDAQKAVELDEKNIKAYFLMGETLV